MIFTDKTWTATANRTRSPLFFVYVQAPVFPLLHLHEGESARAIGFSLSEIADTLLRVAHCLPKTAGWLEIPKLASGNIARKNCRRMAGEKKEVAKRGQGGETDRPSCRWPISGKKGRANSCSGPPPHRQSCRSLPRSAGYRRPRGRNDGRRAAVRAGQSPAAADHSR